MCQWQCWPCHSHRLVPRVARQGATQCESYSSKRHHTSNAASHVILQVVSGLLDAAGACGASFRFGAEVASINNADGRVSGVTLASGERLPADVVVSNRDVSAAYPLLRNEYGSRKAKEVSAKKFSAAVIAYNWSVGKRFDRLQHHNVFLSGRLPFFLGLCLHGQMCRLACARDHASGAFRV